MLQPEVAIPEIVSNLVLTVASAQQTIDAEWRQRMDEYLPILQEAQRLGFEDLGRALAPSQVRVTAVEVKAGMFVRRQTTGGLGGRLFSLGLIRRYDSVRAVNVRMECRIQQYSVQR